jgi:hypothetical protein
LVIKSSKLIRAENKAIVKPLLVTIEFKSATQIAPLFCPNDPNTIGSPIAQARQDKPLPDQ